MEAKTEAKTEKAEHLMYREADIIQWGIDRNLIGPTGEATMSGQLKKTREEAKELRDALLLRKDAGIRDGVGDVYVTLVLQANMWGANMCECLAARRAEMVTNVVEAFDLIDAAMLDLSAAIALHKHHIGDSRTNAKRCISEIYHAIQRIALFTQQDFKTCIDTAWDEIKDRKGRMIGGVFVKEADLPKDSTAAV